MVAAIIWLLIHLVLFFVTKYCQDGPGFPHGYIDGLRMPSLSDLDDTADRYTMQNYTKQVICPSFHYFKLCDEFGNGKETDSTRFLVNLFFGTVSWLFSVKSLFNYFVASQLIGSKFLLCLVSIAIPTVLCLLLRFVIAKLYDRFFAVPTYDEDEEYLRKWFDRCDGAVPLGDAFPVSRDRGFENFVILRYYEYYQEIAYSLRKRYVLASFVDAVAAIIYSLFFMRAEY